MNPAIRLDQHIYQKNDFSPFALTDILTEYSKEHQQIFLHFWQYDCTVILGMKDVRTPFLRDGIQTLKDAGYAPVIRNSGGLGIVSDEGVLNISLIFPQNDQKKITIDGAYEQMLRLTKYAFLKAPIQAFEITHSYCPGTYDLSIHGKKFAGIAQRRIKNGISVMMYLSVNGNQEKRGQVMKRFYQSALKESFGTNGYPAVDPATMATLEELLDHPLLVEEVKEAFAKAFEKLYSASDLLDSTDWLKKEIQLEQWNNQIQRMKQRNNIKELQYDNPL
ncbi:lipoate--protein ligase family protein [Enterococcus lactis]|uniref:lipoate--protein ligase family protein n=1 Tax=Enterococcus TaxID=1350 RepID=UPI002414D439|nr:MULTISPECIES: lipoate--protein ligase family protein [Enterococcus]MDV4765025.1 lipoate--protein ligase family protein [Enterococcus faecium]MDG4615840.1 lipoate--protein ligase family protein [Enterococcus lactis]MEB4751375.1 lipoate--protein ligase family protein [Enterococcus sp. E5-162]NTQ97403.1 lipoate--protein ligase family protein [Enterococcus faecium]HAQ5736524.1 lipoate--protein ligase family protein [Enterococcus faecium]